MTQAADEGEVRTSRDGDVLRVVLDRPSRRNSLSHAMTDVLVEVLTDAATDESLRAIHLQGAGDDFCAGADWVASNFGGLGAPPPEGKGESEATRESKYSVVRAPATSCVVSPTRPTA